MVRSEYSYEIGVSGFFFRSLEKSNALIKH